MFPCSPQIFLWGWGGPGTVEGPATDADFIASGASSSSSAGLWLPLPSLVWLTGKEGKGYDLLWPCQLGTMFSHHISVLRKSWWLWVPSTLSHSQPPSKATKGTWHVSSSPCQDLSKGTPVAFTSVPRHRIWGGDGEGGHWVQLNLA